MALYRIVCMKPEKLQKVNNSWYYCLHAYNIDICFHRFSLNLCINNEDTVSRSYY